MKSNKIALLIKEIAAAEPDQAEIAIVGSENLVHGFSVLLSHVPKKTPNLTRESYAESLRTFGLEKDPQLPWSMSHARLVPKLGSITYKVHFNSLINVEIEVITDIGSKAFNSKTAGPAEVKQSLDQARLHLRAESKEVMKILNMIDDPKLKANYGAA
jgi:hypothetical protein